ncbi:MAG: protoporphyrinogen oxidase [Candidatus Omnitrophota bacterium]
MKDRHAVIVGGGISGLSAAFFLSQKASQEQFPLKITILEASDRWGGVLRTLSHGDLRMESGADAFYGGQSDTLDLCRALGLEGDVIEAAPCFRNFFYLKNNKFYRMQGFPGSWGDVLGFLGNPNLGFAAKCRMLAEPFVLRKSGEEDESIADFVGRRLGKNFYREAVMPLVRGVYMADPEHASLNALFPKWRQAEETQGSLTGSFLDRIRAKKKKSAAEFFTLRQGLEGLARTLERELGHCQLQRSTPVRQCVYDAGWKILLENGAALDADILGLAMNAPDSARLLSSTAPELSRALSAVRYDSISTVSFAYSAEDMPVVRIEPGFWVPADGGQYPFSSFKWLGKSADRKYALARAFISEAMLPEVFHKSDEILSREAATFTGDLFGARSKPLFTDVKRYLKALPQYEVGHLERVAEIEKESSRYPGLFLAGNGLQGFGITDCIRRARFAVTSLRYPMP